MAVDTFLKQINFQILNRIFSMQFKSNTKLFTFHAVIPSSGSIESLSFIICVHFQFEIWMKFVVCNKPRSSMCEHINWFWKSHFQFAYWHTKYQQINEMKSNEIFFCNLLFLSMQSWTIELETQRNWYERKPTKPKPDEKRQNISC